jgi:hypothetical protein
MHFSLFFLTLFAGFSVNSFERPQTMRQDLVWTPGQVRGHLESCDTDLECNRKDTHSVCSLFQCICRQGYKYSAGAMKCVPDLYCEQTRECYHFLSKCENNLCSIQSNVVSIMTSVLTLLLFLTIFFMLWRYYCLRVQYRIPTSWGRTHALDTVHHQLVPCPVPSPRRAFRADLPPAYTPIDIPDSTLLLEPSSNK